MIEVAQIVYGCKWNTSGHDDAWPLRIVFGATGDEVPVDEMLDGRGHAVMLTDQLVSLVRGMVGTDTPIELMRPAPPGLAVKLVEAGFFVALC